jgi:hypothetical protein
MSFWPDATDLLIDNHRGDDGCCKVGIELRERGRAARQMIRRLRVVAPSWR